MQTFSFPIVRSRTQTYSDLDPYLWGRTIADHPQDSRICQTIESVLIDAGLGRREKHAGLPEWSGVPWLTPVLGSGCKVPSSPGILSPDSIREMTKSGLEAHLEDHDSGWRVSKNKWNRVGPGSDPDMPGTSVAQFVGASMPEYVAAFARSLVESRRSSHSSSDDVDSAEESPVPLDDTTLEVLATAAFMTGAYFAAKAADGVPIARYDVGSVSFDEDDDVDRTGNDKSHLRTMYELYRRHLRRINSTKLPALSQTAHIDRAFEVLRDRLNSDSDMDKISLEGLMLMTELTWYLLNARDLQQYPGWNDTLFKLMLADGQWKTFSSRPLFGKLNAVGTKAEELFRSPTRESWKRCLSVIKSSDGAGPAEPNIFDAVASVLIAQADAHRGLGNLPRTADGQKMEGVKDLPVPVAFTTSFDLELVMALYSAIHRSRQNRTEQDQTEQDDLSVYAVMPIEVMPSEHAEVAQFCWLRAEMQLPSEPPDPDDPGMLERSFDQLRRPTNWTLVTDSMKADLGHPHVVFLAGCPLIELPSMSDRRLDSDEDRNAVCGRDADLGPVFLKNLAESLSTHRTRLSADQIRLAHAVIVDEYLAMQQSEAELLWTFAKDADQDKTSATYALPALFTSSSSALRTSGPNPRFWLAMGVPIHDSAIRNRVTTQLTLRNLANKLSHSGPGQTSVDHGTAKGTRVEPSGDKLGFGGTKKPPVTDGDGERVRPISHVQVSWSFEDEKKFPELIGRFFDDLEQKEGVKLFFARRDVDPDDRSYTEKWNSAYGDAPNNIGACGLVLLLSAKSSNSEEVKKEIDHYVDQHQRGHPGALFVLTLPDYDVSREDDPGSMTRVWNALRLLHPEKPQFKLDEDWEKAKSSIVHRFKKANPDLYMGEEGTQALAGVFFNVRLSEQDVATLQWLGLDVVTDRAESLIDELHHYVAHLRLDGNRWDVRKRKCTIGDPRHV